MKLYSLLLSTFLLGGCATSSLNIGADDTLALTYGKEKLSVRGLTLDRKSDSYPELELYQRIIELDDNSLIVYEEVETDEKYQFQHATQNSIKMIFDAKKLTLLYQKNNLCFVQLELKNATFLNIIAQQSDMQSFTQLYGFSNMQMKKIIKTISKEDKKITFNDNVVIFEHFEGSYISKWSTKLIAIDGLMTLSDEYRLR